VTFELREELPTSPGGSKVMYAVKKTEQEMAWEQGSSPKL